MNNLGFLAVAYAVIWVGLALYLLSITRRQRALDRRLDELSNTSSREND